MLHPRIGRIDVVFGHARDSQRERIIEDHGPIGTFSYEVILTATDSSGLRSSTSVLLPVGSDHHAYVRELKAAMAALGGEPDTVELPLLQFVHLVEGGKVFDRHS